MFDNINKAVAIATLGFEFPCLLFLKKTVIIIEATTGENSPRATFR
jgi:hypothetical protein